MDEAVWYDEYGHYRESSKYAGFRIEKEYSEEIQEMPGHHNDSFPYIKIRRSEYGHSQINSRSHDDHR